MELRWKLVLGCALALLLGLAVSVPVLIPKPPAPEIQIDVNIAYAYFSLQEFGENITGLWRNVTDHSDYDLVLYFIVLNVTNRSNGWARIDQFKASAAPEILVINGTQSLGSQSLAERTSVNCSGNCGGTTFSVGEENPLMTDVRDMSKGGDGWDGDWQPNGSRLIGLSGMVQLCFPSRDALINGSMYLYGQAEGAAFPGGSWSMGFDLKHVQLQEIGREFLYNPVFTQNQMLGLYNGLDVYVVSRG
jgi:hypothetical protein